MFLRLDLSKRFRKKIIRYVKGFQYYTLHIDFYYIRVRVRAFKVIGEALVISFTIYASRAKSQKVPPEDSLPAGNGAGHARNPSEMRTRYRGLRRR